MTIFRNQSADAERGSPKKKLRHSVEIERKMRVAEPNYWFGWEESANREQMTSKKHFVEEKVCDGRKTRKKGINKQYRNANVGSAIRNISTIFFSR